MTKLTTPKSILIGFFLIALSIASLPYQIKPANAEWYSRDTVTLTSLLTNLTKATSSVSRSIDRISACRN